MRGHLWLRDIISYIFYGEKMVMLPEECYDGSILNELYHTMNIISFLKTSIYVKIPDIFENTMFESSVE